MARILAAVCACLALAEALTACGDDVVRVRNRSRELDLYIWLMQDREPPVWEPRVFVGAGGPASFLVKGKGRHYVVLRDKQRRTMPLGWRDLSQLQKLGDKVEVVFDQLIKFEERVTTIEVPFTVAVPRTRIVKVREYVSEQQTREVPYFDFQSGTWKTRTETKTVSRPVWREVEQTYMAWESRTRTESRVYKVAVFKPTVTVEVDGNTFDLDAVMPVAQP